MSFGCNIGFISFEISKNRHGNLKVKFAAVSKLTTFAVEHLNIKMASKKKATSFQKAHELTYAIKVISKDTCGDVAVGCLFCVYEGRDVIEVGVAGWKCKQRDDI
jgi:hypothetical protein